jgi:Flp pilus assembly protein TadD
LSVEGWVAQMRGFGAAVSVLLGLGVFALGGCEDLRSLDFDLFDVGGRGGAGPVSYDTLMRVAAASHAGGDLANAVTIYRRAAVLEPHAAAPFVAAGNTLFEMGELNEAILAYKSALERVENEPEALRGLAKAYLRTGRPELAGAPLAAAYQATPNDPKLLLLIGVADDFVGQHKEAQARYRRGLELLPRDPALRLDLALSLALTGNYTEAVGVLRPMAIAPTGTPRQRQTLALIYGLAGDRASAEKMARRDLQPAAVQHNLAYYERLRSLSPEARRRALQSMSNSSSIPQHG